MTLTKEFLLKSSSEFVYMLLDRMKMDCKFYLGYGRREPSALWAGDENRQIAYMKMIHQVLTDRHDCGTPEWLSMDQICEYESKLLHSQKELKDYCEAHSITVEQLSGCEVIKGDLVLNQRPPEGFGHLLIVTGTIIKRYK